ncbi:MAG: FAD:protein FMN transferase [Candidatus Omnitrophota bacterium]|jgi:thiamine biosynthesis lipoprotein
MLLNAIRICCILAIVPLCGCRDKVFYSDKRAMMGTFVEVACSDREALDIVFTEIGRIEGLLSKYKEDSEIFILNSSGEIKASSDTFYILQKAREFWEESGKAFDITVGPLMDIWGFTDKEYRIPAEEEIAQALALAGSDKIIFNPDGNVVKLKVPGMKIDLGAIAKGYAVDRAVEKLREHRISNCLINLGGQVYCMGDKSGRPWSVGVRDPRGNGFINQVSLRDQSIATSGDYEQYFIKEDRRYPHILDPRTGYPADSGIVAVTVISPSGLLTDSLATAIFVLGKEKGMELLKKFPQAEARIIEKKDVRYN